VIGIAQMSKYSCSQHTVVIRTMTCHLGVPMGQMGQSHLSRHVLGTPVTIDSSHYDSAVWLAVVVQW